MGRPPLNMNSFEGKRILALVRDGDYAHAGEEEAIERSFRSLPKLADRWMLDVGCGRGGSADYLRRHGWGQVEGIDRDAESIDYARAKWPEVSFHVCDVLDLARTVTRKFDVIYMLNAFYAFDRQADALAVMRQVANPGAHLLIFDYTVGPKATSRSGFLPHPIELSGIAAMLRDAGWVPGATEDLGADYVRWYDGFVDRVRSKQGEIENIGGADAYNFVLSMYSGLRDAVAGGSVGGVLVHARAA